MRVIGDPILSQKAVPIVQIDEDIRKFGTKLLEMMLEYDGVGLAAPQVGVGLRIIALLVPRPNPANLNRLLSPGEELLAQKMPAVIINPRILSFSEECESREEGCLSIPNIFASVERSSRIIFEGLVNYNEKITIECAGLLARAIQHELDHLDGILFVDRLDKKTFAKIKKRLGTLKKDAAKNNYIREMK